MAKEIAPFRLLRDSAANLVAATYSTYWSDADGQAYEDAMAKMIATMAAAFKEWSMVVDVREYPVQSKKIFCIHQGVLERAMRGGMNKAAYFGTSALIISQVVRMAEPVNAPVSFFSSHAQALSWIRGDSPASAWTVVRPPGARRG